MRIGVLGTGMVGSAMATRLAGLGHDVCMGSRLASNQKAMVWAAATGGRARRGTFADAAAFGELIVNATAGMGSVAALEAAGAGLEGKVVLDLANPVDFSGPAPRLSVANDDSLAEQLQRAHPAARLVKALNTLTVEVMLHPQVVPGAHTVFVSGDDAKAKVVVTDLLQSLGWPADAVLDLGPLSTARGTEAYLLLWLAVVHATGSARFNVGLLRP